MCHGVPQSLTESGRECLGMPAIFMHEVQLKERRVIVVRKGKRKCIPRRTRTREEKEEEQ